MTLKQNVVLGYCVLTVIVLSTIAAIGILIYVWS